MRISAPALARSSAARRPDNDDQVIYFNSVGAGILDLAVTTRCYREALKRNVGTWVPYWV